MLVLPLSLLALLLVIASISYAIPVVRLMSVRLRQRRALAWADVDELPADVFTSLRLHGARLEALDFVFAGALRDEDAIDGVDTPTWSLIYRSPDGATWARITLSDSPMRAQPVDLSFVSFGAPRLDAAPLLYETVAWRLHRLTQGLPGHRLVDARTFDPAEHWAAHRRRVEGADPAVILHVKRDEYVDCMDRFRRRGCEHQLAEHRLVARPDGTLRHALAGALGLVARANRGEGARLRALAAAGDDDPTARDLTADLVAHRRREAVEASKRRRSSLRKTLLFLASMLLFLAIFGMRFSIETVLLLVVVLILHELGHALAMWVFGYRDLQILFVPFLGAVASGQKDDVAPWQEIVVLLAGPMPGIALGTWLMTSGAADRDAAVYSFTNILLILNFINLLPVHPLDGGKIMSIALFDRFPAVQLGFSALSSVVILAGGLYISEYAIACVGLALLLGVPGQVTQTRTFLKLRRALGQAGQRAVDPLRAIYEELQAPDFDRWNSETRYQFVTRIREQLGRELAGRRVVAASLAVYVAAWVVPVDALLDHHIAKSQSAPQVEEQAEQGATAAEPQVFVPPSIAPPAEAATGEVVDPTERDLLLGRTDRAVTPP